jgi:hypothetical protein
MSQNNFKLETIKISWFSHILHFSRMKPSIYKPNDFKLTSVFKNMASKNYSTTKEVLAYLHASNSEKLLLELEEKGFEDLVRLYKKTTKTLQDIEIIDNEVYDLQSINNNLNLKLKKLEDRLNVEINEDSLKGWNEYLVMNNKLINWKEVDSGRRRNGSLIGGFYCDWALDSGYINLYLKLPIKSDPNWYLKIVYPMLDGNQTKRTIQSKNFLGLCSFITEDDFHIDIEITEFISSCTELSKEHHEISKITNLFFN